MLKLATGASANCEGLTRREWLQVGGLGTMGLLLPELVASRAASAALSGGTFGRAKSCIVLFLFGAPAHQDLWDLKPDAPSEVRGEFKPIRTNVPGIDIGELLPKTARQAHRYALVRSVTHPDDTHTVAMHAMLTGVRHREPQTNPRNQPTDFPCFGAVMQAVRPPINGMPSGISLNSPANQVSANNHIFPGFFAGFLGHRHDPVFIADDPSSSKFKPFQVPEALSLGRLERRRGLLAEVDAQRRALVETAETRSYSDHHQTAFDLVTSAAARRAFDLSQEPAALREKYGKSAFGQGCLLARRLTEAGVGLVTVNWARDDAFWDTHANNFRDLREKLCPPFDAGFSALLEDLDQRGRLEDTLVIALGEFGRTPAINKNAGRDHWAACNTVVFAGGGIRGGQVYGASDKIAAYPSENAVTPADVAATLYHLLGVPLATELLNPQGQPVPLCLGEPIRPLFT